MLIRRGGALMLGVCWFLSIHFVTHFGLNNATGNSECNSHVACTVSFPSQSTSWSVNSLCLFVFQLAFFALHLPNNVAFMTLFIMAVGKKMANIKVKYFVVSATVQSTEQFASSRLPLCNSPATDWQSLPIWGWMEVHGILILPYLLAG